MRLMSSSLCLTATLTAAAAADVPTDTTCAGPPCNNFTQKLNHDKPNDSTTFSQRYQVDTSHLKPGGSILFHQVAESSLTNDPFPQHVFNDYAPKLGAMVVVLEHRYYGTSYPNGLTFASNITTEQYAPLSLDNIFEDSIAFLKWLKSTVAGAENSPVIYASGSYGGFLAIMARVRYSDVFAGSVAFNPVCRSWGASANIVDNPYKFAAMDKVANLYWDTNADAARKIKAALAVLNKCVNAQNCDTELPDLNLCAKPESIVDWYTLLNNVIIEEYIDLPQLDPSGLNLPTLINATLVAKTPAEVLRAPIDLAPVVNNTAHSGCSNWRKIAGSEAFLASVGIGSSWLYMTCNWMIYSVGAISPSNSLFPERAVDTPYPGCDTVENVDWVGSDMNKTNAEWEAKFNITDEDLDQVKNLLIINGSKDRTAPVCSPKLTTSTDRSHSRVIEVWDMAHGDSTLSETFLRRGLRQQVDAIRDAQLAYIQEWLNISQVDVAGAGPNNGTSGARDGNPTSSSVSMRQQWYTLASFVGSLLTSLIILV